MNKVWLFWSVPARIDVSPLHSSSSSLPPVIPGDQPLIFKRNKPGTAVVEPLGTPVPPSPEQPERGPPAEEEARAVADDGEGACMEGGK